MNWSNGPSSAGMQRTRLSLPTVPVIVNTAVTTGVINLQYTISANRISAFVSRYQSVFNEFRIESCTVEVSPLTPDLRGVCYVWWEEEPIVPTTQEAITRTADVIPVNNSAQHTFRYRWTGRDFADEEWLPVTTAGAAVASAQFTMYSDSTLGNNVGSSNTYSVRAVFRVAFRGLASL